MNGAGASLLTLMLVSLLVVLPLPASAVGGPCANEVNAAEPFSMVTWGDTQNYVNHVRYDLDNDPNDGITHYEHLLATTQWVLDDPQGHGFVLGLIPGDLVQTPFGCATSSCQGFVPPTDPNNRGNQEADRVDAAFQLLYGSLPLVYTSGNHDSDVDGDKTFAGYLNRYGDPFWQARALATPGWTFVGSDLGEPSAHPQEGAGLNHFHLVDIGAGRTIAVLALSLDPPQAAIDWANSMLDLYPDMPTVVLAHILITPANLRAGIVYPPGLGSNEWAAQLIDTHPQVFLAVSGHVTGGPPEHIGKSFLLKTNPSPDRSHLEMTHNMQGRAEGGSGLLGIIKVTPRLKLCEVTSYSPSLDVLDPLDPPPVRSFECDLSRFGPAWGGPCPISVFPYSSAD